MISFFSVSQKNSTIPRSLKLSNFNIKPRAKGKRDNNKDITKPAVRQTT